MSRLIPLYLLCLSLALPTQAETLRDIAYGPAPEQRYDLHLPAAPQNVPTILMVHGGGWFRGDKNMERVVDNKAARWLPRGIAFASTNYRMQPQAAPLEQARDVARALASLQRIASQYGIAPDTIVLMGHSAGAHLIALLAARPDLLAEAGAQKPLGYVLLDSGALDVPSIMNKHHLRLYDRAFGSNPADWVAVSPYHQLRQATPPMLAVCSTRRADACPQARALAEKTQGLGASIVVLPQDMTHGEINAQLGQDGDYTNRVEHFIGGLSPRLAERLR